MWIVRIALNRPYTFVVLAMVLLILGPLAIVRTPTDILPEISIPVISVVWNYNGLSAEEMSTRIVFNVERSFTTLVNDIEHTESQSLNGIGIIKVFFHPSANVEMALAQVTASSQTLLRQLPPGTNPPLVISYNASSVPILQLGLSGESLSEQQLFDLGFNFIRTQLATVQGASIPLPYGGRQRQVQVDLDLMALQAKGLTPGDVVSAISAQNLILPAGTSKIGSREYDVDINAGARTVDELNGLPIRVVGGVPIYIRDVAHVRDGAPPQTNIARVDGRRSALLTIQKTGSASTLDIIDRIKATLPRIQASLTQDLKVRLLADQSLFVRAAINGVVREAVLAAALTALMILLFLGSWRSTLIISTSIPLSILASVIVLGALGETINIMTLGGLALAVGVLVDDATVAIENISSNLEEGKALEQAILDGSEQIAVPAFVSTICICIVFVPLFFLTGVAKFLFVPLGEAVVFAMLASYVLSRTLVPTMAKYLLRGHEEDALGHTWKMGGNSLARLQRVFELGVNRVRVAYRRLLEAVIPRRGWFVAAVLLFCGASLSLASWVGADFFPAVDSGQFRLHLRAPTGTRIEETAALCDRVEAVIRERVPRAHLGTIIDNIGLPYSGINLTYSTSAPIGTGDADILVGLEGDHEPTSNYIRDLRRELVDRFPGVTFAFLPADIVSQILNFGLPAPIDVQILGNNREANRKLAAGLLTRINRIPGIVDLHIHQPMNQPKLHITVDRTRAADLGLTQRDVANNLLVSLSGSQQTSPTFWLNPTTGVSYFIATSTPQYRMESLGDLAGIPLPGDKPQILGALASFERGSGLAVVSHYDVQPAIDLFGSVQGRDLGGVSRDLNRIIREVEPSLPRGTRLMVRGEIATMTSSFTGLLAGLLLAVVLVYLLIVVNFQSWTDPFIIISALPAALAGIVWMLFATATTLSVPALTGAIMCVGVATANSILVVSFAKDELAKGMGAVDAAIAAGFARFRPVIMTALAMIIGMVPMAFGMGEGGEQNAPLGRAVIGGLLFATFATLFFVPSVFALLHRKSGSDPVKTAVTP
jgi:multidrug efflux pump subunit AcrB